ncbi:tyrosine-protein phosphatase [Lentibacillus sp.]|uniref:tyrosine-protein phosphatase n=1 Tax=Lentibacillus sp. TaxID=1925746 RepID=UPI002B4AF60C|nr:CpsB/CapC family capsule biosynthesis tyrosine phosphatase [Lentibacillus sp.]HLS10217.1 CpsB/CapC family capsule biosynthesis tyrosine phosphatase [Lentibacillus sp.]
MIDIHCHILPGIDDGAQTINDTLDMAKAAVDQGIHHIVATPHHRNGKYDNIKTDILKYTSILNDKLAEEDIQLTILPGQETRINGDMVEGLEQGEILPINENTKYVFVEFPSGHIPRYAKQLLFDIQLKGYMPVIVHPERNKEIMEDPDKLYRMVEKGVLSQVTASSVCGKFGKKIQKFSHQLIETNLTHFIASDAHNTSTRGFYLKDAYDELHKAHGNETFYLFRENPNLMIDGKMVNHLPPEQIKKKSIFGLF